MEREISPTIRLDGNSISRHKNNLNCYKNGRVMAVEKSSVRINTCNGISGFIELGDESYYICPVLTKYSKSLYGFHKIYRLHGANKINQKKIEKQLRIPTTSMSKDKYKIVKQKKNENSKEKVLKMSFVIPYISFKNTEYFKESKHLVISFAKETVFYLKYYFEIFSIRPILMHVDIHTKSDQDDEISASSFAEDIINTGRLWRWELEVEGHAHDVTILLSPFSHNHSTGFSYAGLLCQKEYSVIVATLIQPKFLVSTIAHEIGHLFGLPHTEERTNLDKCPCHNICMMDSMVHRIDFKDIFWSECDKSEILRELKNDKDCLSFYSEANLNQQALCGNKVVDPGEECDCGFLKECQKEDSRKCCDPLSCKFTKGSNCYKGNCCNNCQIRKASEKCHMEQQECKHGLCDGISSNCRIFLDYNYDNNNEKELTCNYGKDQCFKGKCIRRDSTCEILYGEKSHYAPSKCYNYFNIMNDSFGHCGKTHENKYIACNIEDTLCGKIICEGYTIDYISNKYVLYLDCISTSDESKLAKDIYLVPNGIKCGENKICQNQKCINIEKAEKSLNYKICGRYGKMISKNNCECTNTKLIKIDGVCYLRENYSSTQRKAICILIIIWNFIYIKFLYKNYKRIIYDSKRHYITV